MKHTLSTSLIEAHRIERLTPPPADSGRLDMVLDTDTFNEIDDQFALAHALLSPDRLNMEAVYAAPFVNDHRAATPAEGMSQSYDEILRVYERLGRDGTATTFRGSEAWMTDTGEAVPSASADDLVQRAMARHADDTPLYVVAIGACTNVSSAILVEPAICERIVVVWLGGNPHYWPQTHEFNLAGDVAASRVLFNSGVPLVHVPCVNVAQKLRTSVAELRQHIGGKNALSDFLLERYAEYEEFEAPKKVGWNDGRPIAYCKEIWDIATIAWLIDPSWCPSTLRSSPILTDQLTWSCDGSRHQIREVFDLNRDAIFGDLFAKLAAEEPRG
ncbi:MAG: nucleoside hydrolase [Planctomycetota bacterium]